MKSPLLFLAAILALPTYGFAIDATDAPIPYNVAAQIKQVSGSRLKANLEDNIKFFKAMKRDISRNNLQSICSAIDNVGEADAAPLMEFGNALPSDVIALSRQLRFPSGTVMSGGRFEQLFMSASLASIDQWSDFNCDHNENATSAPKMSETSKRVAMRELNDSIAASEALLREIAGPSETHLTQ
ncbi:MAG: hypothetical protein P4M08_06665 [Oligoflexia bacterium]|nr:hypothetical protein [Oligoflexia bacterium]